MNPKAIKVLLIEDNPGDTRLIVELLSEVQDFACEIECVDRLSKGLQRLAEGGIDVALVDLTLPDSKGLPTFAKAHAQAPHVPIIVLTGLDDERFAVQTVYEGGQDYLVKGQVNG